MVIKSRDCTSCKQCNHKGKPSVTKYSLYCDKNYINKNPSLFELIKKRLTILSGIKEFMFNKRYNEIKDELNTKGFRKRYFED